MPLSAPAETAPAVWAQLARVRDISRLVLVAIETNDLPEVQRLSRESNEILASLRAQREEEGGLSPEFQEIINVIGNQNRRIVEELQSRMLDLKSELATVRQSRARIKSSQLPSANLQPTSLDRET